jgi:hypothetical protein
MSYTNAGDNTSVVLNSFRDRALASIGGVKDDIGYFEWSAPTDEITLENARHANPSMGNLIHEDNIRSVLNDPPNVVMSEVLCRWTHHWCAFFTRARCCRCCRAATTCMGKIRSNASIRDRSRGRSAYATASMRSLLVSKRTYT